jgi:hypothetical protein
MFLRSFLALDLRSPTGRLSSFCSCGVCGAMQPGTHGAIPLYVVVTHCDEAADGAQRDAVVKAVLVSLLLVPASLLPHPSFCVSTGPGSFWPEGSSL